MRPHLAFHQTLRPALGYPQQSRKRKKLRKEDRQPEFIGGTVPWLGPRRTFDLMRGMPGAEDGSGKILHITVSLPKGMRLDREAWSKIVRQTLTQLGLPDTGVPWLCFQHRDTDCDHVGITALAVTFDGRRIALSNLDQRCAAAHNANCFSLGLEPPPYQRPGAPPRHDIFLPARRQTSAERKTIAASIHRILRERQPTNPDAFIAALAENGSRVTARQNTNGSWFFQLKGQEVAGEWLSPELAAWPMARRFELARQLRAMRGLIAERLVERGVTNALVDRTELTKGQPDARRSSPGHFDLGGRLAEAAGVAGPADADLEADRTGGPSTSTLDRALDPAGRPVFGRNQPAGRAAQRDARPSGPHRGRADGDQLDPHHPHLAADQPGGADHGAGEDAEGPARRPRRRLNRAWVLAREAVRAAGLKTLPQVRPDKSVSVRFADESAARLSETDVTLMADGRDRGAMARRFASAVARMMGWVDVAAHPTWPFARLPEIGDPLAVTYDRLRSTIVTRVAKANPLFLNPTPEVCRRAIDLLTKTAGSVDLAPGPLPESEPIVILTPECERKLLEDPKAALDRLPEVLVANGNLLTLVLQNDQPPRPARLADLITLYENKIPRAKRSEVQPSSSPVPKHDAAAPTAISYADEGASPVTAPASEPDTPAEIPEDEDSNRMGM